MFLERSDGLYYHHHHHHMSVMQLGHLLTRSGLTYLEVYSEVCHDSLCILLHCGITYREHLWKFFRVYGHKLYFLQVYFRITQARRVNPGCSEGAGKERGCVCSVCSVERRRLPWGTRANIPASRRPYVNDCYEHYLDVLWHQYTRSEIRKGKQTNSSPQKNDLTVLIGPSSIGTCMFWLQILK